MTTSSSEPALVCESCEEELERSDIEEKTWQQWRCPVCGWWNDRGFDDDFDDE